MNTHYCIEGFFSGGIVPGEDENYETCSGAKEMKVVNEWIAGSLCFQARCYWVLASFELNGFVDSSHY